MQVPLGGGVATALIASLAAVSVGVDAQVTCSTGNCDATNANWGTVTFYDKDDTINLNEAKDITIGYLRDDAKNGDDREKLTINAAGSNFTIGSISVSMHHYGADLVMNDVGDVTITGAWNPANTNSAFHAKEGEDAEFKATESNFYQYGSYNVGKVSSTADFSNFKAVDFGRLIVNQGATISLKNVGNATFSSFQKKAGETLHFTLQDSGLTLEAEGTNVDKVTFSNSAEDKSNTIAVKTDAVIGELWDAENGVKDTLKVTVDEGYSLTINKHQYANADTGGAEVTINGAKNVFNDPSGSTDKRNNFANATLTVNAGTTAGELFELGNTDFNASHSQVWVSNYNRVELGNIAFQSHQEGLNKQSGIFLTNAKEVELGKVTTNEKSKSVLAFKGGSTDIYLTDDVKITSLYGRSSENTWYLNGHNLTVSGTDDSGSSSSDYLSTWTNEGLNMNTSKFHAVGTGTETVDVGNLRMGNGGLTFELLDAVRIAHFSVSESTDHSPDIRFDDVRSVDLTFGKDGTEKYDFDLNLGQSALGKGGEARIDMTDLKAAGETAGKHAFTFNVASALEAPQRADEFAQVRFVKDDWNKSTVTLGKGAWLRLGETEAAGAADAAGNGFHAETAVNEALRAFEGLGKSYSSVVTLAGQSDWTGLEQTLEAADGSLLFVTDAAAANGQTALLTGTNGALAEDVGLYLSVAPDQLGEFKTGTVLKIADGDWSKLNGEKVGVDSLFTEWSAVGTKDGLDYKFEKYKSVTEVLPEVIPQKGFEEIYGKPDEEGGWDEGKGIIFVDDVTGEIGTGGIFAQTLTTLASGDPEGTSDLINAYSAVAAVAGAQSGAFSTASMTADALARHYSFVTTTGVEGADAHRPGTDLWVDLLYRHEETRGLENGTGTYGNRTNLAGFALGLDRTLDESLTVGGVFNYVAGRSDTSERAPLSARNEIESFGFTAWAGWNVSDRCNLVASLGYAKGSNEIESPMSGDMADAFSKVYADYAARRPEGLPESIGTDVTAETDTETFSLGLRAEHVIRTALFDVIPHVGVRWDRIKTDGYELRTGGVAAMETSVKTMDVFSLPLGVAVAKSHTDSATGWSSRLTADAYVMPRFGDTEATVTTRLLPYSSKDTAETDVMSDLVGGATVGVEVFTKTMSFGFRAGLEGSDQGTAATAGVQAAFRF